MSPKQSDNVKRDKEKTQLKSKLTGANDRKSLNEPVYPPELGPLSENIVLDCAISGDVVRLIRCFEDPQDVYHSVVSELVNKRNTEDGRAPLDWAAIFGHTELITVLIKNGALVDAINEKGYTALHFGCAWNHADCVRALNDNGADRMLKTLNEERAIDIAQRYNHIDCVDVLELLEAATDLKDAVQTIKDFLAGAKLMSAPDKLTVSTLVNNELKWLESSKDALSSDFVTRKKQFEDAVAAITGSVPAKSVASSVQEKPVKAKTEKNVKTAAAL